MIKKYKEFSESSEEKFILSIKDTDLDADYEFHKNLCSEIEEVESLFEELDKNYSEEKDRKYCSLMDLLEIEINKYITKIFHENNLNCSAYLFDKIEQYGKSYSIYFIGDEDDLENINKYFGLPNNKNISKERLNEIGKGWTEFN